LSGHEHSLKYLEVLVDGEKGFKQIVSGAATKMENCLHEKHVISYLDNRDIVDKPKFGIW
jgi:hypothetical protein